MISYVLVLRGINVGGRRKILMVDLKTELSKLGLKNCQTYIQSGNVVFQSSVPIIIAEFELKIADLILSKFGHKVPVIILTVALLKSIIKNNPFVEGKDVKDLHCTFFNRVPSQFAIESFNKLDFSPDQFLTTKNALYLHCNQKFSDCKLTNAMMEKQLGVVCTTRNWKTTLKLQELLEALSN